MYAAKSSELPFNKNVKLPNRLKQVDIFKSVIPIAIKSRPAPRRPEFWYDKETGKFVKFESLENGLSINNSGFSNITPNHLEKIQPQIKASSTTTRSSEFGTSAASEYISHKSSLDAKDEILKIEKDLLKQDQLESIYKTKFSILHDIQGQLDLYLDGDFSTLPVGFDLIKIIDTVKNLERDIVEFKSTATVRKLKVTDLHSRIHMLFKQIIVK